MFGASSFASSSMEREQSVPMTEEELADDPIVHEIPVYLSQDLSYNLHLLQYPLRTPDRPYSDVGPLIAAKSKPRLRKLELHYALNDDAERYNNDAEFDMVTLKLASRSVTQKSNYAVALFKDNRVYLTPLHACLRMFPSVDHVDAADEEDKTEREEREANRRGGSSGSGGAGGSAGGDEKGGDDEDMKQVTQRVRRREPERPGVQTIRRLTYGYLKMLQDQEQWLDLNIVPKDVSN